MKLSISNIAWNKELDIGVYDLMKKYGFTGLEIAPTRIFSETPYGHNEEAKQWAERLKKDYGFVIPSMQSIWFGRQEKLFGSAEERNNLIEYTNKAIDFASVIGCKNLVFGCPKNRNKPENASDSIAYGFLNSIGDYAYSKKIKIGVEANPAIYGTNYLNTTEEAIKLIKAVPSKGLGLNLDFGTIIQNSESLDVLENNITFISHVHISEPYLSEIRHRKLHAELARMLKSNGYAGFVSVEMKSGLALEKISEIMGYVKETFE